MSLFPEQKCSFISRVTDTKINMRTFFPRPNFVSPELRCLMKRGVPKERFHYIHFALLFGVVKVGLDKVPQK